MKNNNHDFIIARNPSEESFLLWKLDPNDRQLLTSITLGESAKIDPSFKIAQVGNYLLQWGPLQLDEYYPCFPYRLSNFDPTNENPLGAEAVQEGVWQRSKFWRGRIDFGQAEGDNQKQFYDQKHVELLPFGSYVLNWIPTAGRGTYRLWNFDPGSSDPLPTHVGPQEPWGSIQDGHQLLPIGAYLIDWVPNSGEFRLWSFDPQGRNPITRPVLQQGQWQGIDGGHQLVPIGEYVLDWVPADRSYRLWKFDSENDNVLSGPVSEGTLPEELTENTTLTGIQPLLPIREDYAQTPGTTDFFRSKIKHVVYYMIENRSLDHVCGWLYENDVPNQIIGPQGPYNGAKTTDYNYDTAGQKIPLSKYADGKVGDDILLEFLFQDPYHEHSDVMRQLFYENQQGYENRDTPNMGGFVWNNGNASVMQTFCPNQLPVLNGLAKHFAISDQWFSSMPGGTDVNRAFSLTGSAYNMLNNFQNPPEYEYWPQMAHRPSIWKILWSNGFRDWKIYNSTVWFDVVFSYHLFLDGQIPTVDNNTADYVSPIKNFYDDAKNGTLPAFSYLEPIWCAETGSTSYHPGGDLIPGERELNNIFNALQNSPNWEDTLFIITFDEHGGIYDHEPPPYAANPYPNDENNGFKYDLMGPRVPTILVSPWINEKTVFRSEQDTQYDSTSILATLLSWYGIPRSRWGLGQRTDHAPTFEGTLLRDTARSDRYSLEPPHDRDFPTTGPANSKLNIHDLHRMMVPRMVWHIAGNKMSVNKVQRIAAEILETSDNLGELNRALGALRDRLSGDRRN